MRHRIEVQKFSSVSDGMGGMTNTWTTEDAVRCAIWPVSAAEQVKAGRELVLDPNHINSAYAISEAAKQGDALSIEAYAIAGKYLGIGVANFLHAFDPSVVVFGGGVSQSGPILFDPFEASLKERVIHPRYLEGLVITRAELGDDAGLLGARALAELKLKI